MNYYLLILPLNHFSEEKNSWITSGIKRYNYECVIKSPELLMFQSHGLKITKEYSVKFLSHKIGRLWWTTWDSGTYDIFTHQLILSY